MAILQSCCCWRSVRKGSYASAIYTTGYFTVITVLMSRMLHDETQYLQGNRTTPQTTSVLEPNAVSPSCLQPMSKGDVNSRAQHAYPSATVTCRSNITTVGLTVVLLCCATCGILTSLLLIYGLYIDNRVLLVPWILTVIVTLLVDLAHVVYMFIVGTMTFEPLTAMLITMDFFLLSLNLYSLLCVVSQYQEYKAGRGRRDDDVPQRVPPVKYAPHPTATSCLSTRRAATYQETRASPTQSPTAPHSTLLGDDSAAITKSPYSKGTLRKHVKFPDDVQDTTTKINEVSDVEAPSGDAEDSGAVVVVTQEQWPVASKAPPLLCPGVDTALLITGAVPRQAK